MCDATEQVFEDYGVNAFLETYSSAGLHHHHTQNQNHALVSSGEGNRLLSNISLKEGRSESERAQLNKLWNGKGYKTSLRDGESEFNKTSFSMAIFV